LRSRVRQTAARNCTIADRRFSTGKPNLQVVGGFFMPVLLPARGGAFNSNPPGAAA
jgi:hypothetical protein